MAKTKFSLDTSLFWKSRLPGTSASARGGTTTLLGLQGYVLSRLILFDCLVLWLFCCFLGESMDTYIRLNKR